MKTKLFILVSLIMLIGCDNNPAEFEDDGSTTDRVKRWWIGDNSSSYGQFLLTYHEDGKIDSFYTSTRYNLLGVPEFEYDSAYVMVAQYEPDGSVSYTAYDLDGQAAARLEKTVTGNTHLYEVYKEGSLDRYLKWTKNGAVTELLEETRIFDDYTRSYRYELISPNTYHYTVNKDGVLSGMQDTFRIELGDLENPYWDKVPPFYTVSGDIEFGISYPYLLYLSSKLPKKYIEISVGEYMDGAYKFVEKDLIFGYRRNQNGRVIFIEKQESGQSYGVSEVIEWY